MAPVVEAVRAAARASGTLDDGAVVLLSGGRDSVCLLDVAVAIAGEDRVRALHVNYGLRPGAAGDVAACAALCDALAVPLDVHRPGAPPDRGNRQAWARDERYAVGSAVAARRAVPLASAHTATDQAETILYRLAASPGRRALLGMELRSGTLVRPLLGVTREETGQYCVARGLRFRDDPSNDTGAFARGRVRHDLVPALRAIHPAAERNVVRTAELLRAEAAVLDELVAGTLDPDGSVPVARIAGLPPALARLLLRTMAETATGTFCARAADRLDDVLALGDGVLDLGDGARAEVRAGRLSLGRTPPLPGR